MTNTRPIDPIAAVLVGAGAILVLRGSTDLVDVILFGAAFWGLSRVLAQPKAIFLVGAPALVWLLRHFWTFAPERLQALSHEHRSLETGTQWLGALVFDAAIIASLILARSVIGWGLAAFAAGAFGIAFLAQTATLPLDGSTPMTTLIVGTSAGWSAVAHALGAVSWLVLAIGAPPVQPLPRRAGAIMGAIGAALVTALLVGLESAHQSEGIMLVFFVTVAAWILVAIGLGAVARVGAKAGWAGLGLVIFQILTIPAALSVVGERSIAAWVTMSIPFALLGLAITALSARAFPLPSVRLLVGSLSIVALAGSLFTWIVVAADAKNLVRSRQPFWMLAPIVVPAATVALVAWAAYLAFIAAPPRPRA